MKGYLSLFCFLFVICAWGHAGEVNTQPNANLSDRMLPSEMPALMALRPVYDAKIKPIFEKKCFDCHAPKRRTLPWYASLPIIKGMIQDDLHGATEHFDMTDGVPFGGQSSLKKDLKILDKVVSHNRMPPTLYKLMHPSHELTPEEMKTIIDWIALGQSHLQ